MEPSPPRSSAPAPSPALDNVGEPPHLGLGEVILIRQNIAFAHPLGIDLVVGGDYGKFPLHPEVNSLTEFALHVATQGLHAASRGLTQGDVLGPEALAEVYHCVRKVLQLGDLLVHGLGERAGGLNGGVPVPLELWRIIETLGQGRQKPNRQGGGNNVYLPFGPSGF
jgi:hypothetical protein